jgi:hypothetical protein
LLLTGEELEALEAQVGKGESIHLVAQRILKQALGLSTVVDTTVDVSEIEKIVQSVVNDRLSQLEEDFNSSLRSIEDTLSREIDSLKKLKAPTKPDTISAIAAIA